MDRAIEEAQLSLKYHPNNINTLNNLGAALNLVGALDKAVEVYQKALSSIPNASKKELPGEKG